MWHATTGTGVSVDEVVDRYWRFLACNTNYAVHFEQFKKRYQSAQKAAEAEAVVFSLLRAEKLNPEIFEDAATGGPDFRCTTSLKSAFLLEVTSLDSNSVSKKSGLPLKITGPGGGAFGLITEKLQSAAKNKAMQMGGHGLPGILAITSDYDFAGMLLDKGPAESFMTSALQTNVPLNGEHSYTTTDLQHAAFCRCGLLNASGEQMVSPCRQSISAILLVTIYQRESRVVGLLHPEPANAFDPHLLAKVPFVRFTHWPLIGGKVETEWVFGDEQHRAAAFQHRLIQ